MAIIGVGVVGGFGCGMTDLAGALTQGGAAVKTVSVKTSKGMVSQPALLADPSSLERFVPKRAVRRIDHFSRLALLAAHLALEDAGKLHAERQKMGLVVATGYGATRTTFAFLDSVINDGDPYASPTLFSNSVHNAAAGHLSILLGVTGPCLTVSQFDMSVASSLLSAWQWLDEERADTVLLGGVDEYCEVLGYCRHRLPGCQSAVIGEGAAFFVLSRDAETSPPYGFISDLQIGNHWGRELSTPHDALLLLDACSSEYRQYIRGDSRVASYSPIYGSLPVGMAFDMAIASLSLKEGKVFPSPKAVGNPFRLNIIEQEQDLIIPQFCCVKLTENGQFAVVTLARR